MHSCVELERLSLMPITDEDCQDRLVASGLLHL